MRLITDFFGVEKCEEAFNLRPPAKFYYIQITSWLFLTKCELCLADLRGQVWLPGVPALHGCHQLLLTAGQAALHQSITAQTKINLKNLKLGATTHRQPPPNKKHAYPKVVTALAVELHAGGQPGLAVPHLLRQEGGPASVALLSLAHYTLQQPQNVSVSL